MNAFLSNGKTRIVPLFILLLLCGGGLAVFVLTASPAGASIIFSTPTPTQENLWAYADVAKPTFTATPTFIPTETLPPAPTFTATPGEMVMEIVQDTAAPVHEAQTVPDQPVVSYGGSKYILVDISDQHMYVYEGDVMIYSFVASTGIGNSTRVGTFQVQSKIPNAYGSTWNIWMPSWLGIYWSHGLENGIHALPILSNGATLWSGFLGSPVSYGCVVLGSYEAKLLYDWAELGTPVEIRW
jgi:lipoprotein-anchoring transpeptidase ErfK/SrfK